MSVAAPYAPPRAVAQFHKKRRRWPRWLRVTRGGLGYFVMGLIVLCGAVWSFGALVEIGNVATTKQSLTTLPTPYAGILFAGSVDLFIFYGYLKCYGPAWQIALAVFHILAGLATSLWFQWQHSKGNVDPVAVSVVPALAVAVSLDTWVVSQLVTWRNDRKLPRTRSHTVMAGSGGQKVETPKRPHAPVASAPAAASDAGGADAPSPTTPPVPVPVPTRGLSKADKQALYRARTSKQDPAGAVAKVIHDRGLDRSLVDATQNGSKP